MKLDRYLKPCTKTYSRWIVYLTGNDKIVKLLEGITSGYLHDLRLGNNFLNTIQKVLTEKEKTDKLHHTKIKNFLFIKRHHKETEKTSHRMRLYLQ